MSNRAMAQHYNGAPTVHGGGGGGDLDLFGFKSKRRLKEYQGMSDIDKARMIELENLGSTNKIKETSSEQESRGKQDRLTLADKQKLESILGKEHSAQVIDEYNQRIKADTGLETHKQYLDYSKSKGIPYSESNLKVADQLLTDPTLQGLLGKQVVENQDLVDPEMEKAARIGRMGTYAMPGFTASKLSEHTVGPLSGMQFNPAQNLMGQPVEAVGGTDLTTRLTSAMDLNDPTKRITMPSETQQQIPAQFKQPVNPAILQQVLGGNDQPTSSVTPPNPLQTMPQNNLQQPSLEDSKSIEALRQYIMMMQLRR